MNFHRLDFPHMNSHLVRKMRSARSVDWCYSHTHICVCKMYKTHTLCIFLVCGIIACLSWTHIGIHSGKIGLAQDALWVAMFSARGNIWAHSGKICLVQDCTTDTIRGDVYTFARRLWSGISRPEVKMSDSTTRQTRDLDVSCLDLEDELMKVKTHCALVAQRFFISWPFRACSTFQIRIIYMTSDVVLFSSSKWSTFQSIITRLLLTFDTYRYISYSLVNPYRES